MRLMIVSVSRLRQTTFLLGLVGRLTSASGRFVILENEVGG